MKALNKTKAMLMAGTLAVSMSLVGCGATGGTGTTDNPGDMTETSETASGEGAETADLEDAIDPEAIMLNTAESVDEAVAEAGVGGMTIPDSIVVGSETFAKPSSIEYDEGMVNVIYQSDKIELDITKSKILPDQASEGEDALADIEVEADEADAQGDGQENAGDAEDAQEEVQESPSWQLTSGTRTYRCSGMTEGMPDVIEWTDEAAGIDYTLICFDIESGDAVLTNDAAIALADQIS